jgi:DNA-directed RNA polymerase subunit M/transcription elongation factor TFIIS
MHRIEHPNEFRHNVQFKILENLRTYSNSDIWLKWSENLEIGIYNFAIAEANNHKIIKSWMNPFFVQLYVDRFRSLYTNLPAITEKMSANEITPVQVATMTHQEFNPSTWKDLLEAKMKRDQAKRNNKVEAMTDMYTCKRKKCRSRRITFVELQIRSADEPSTVICTCLDCGNVFTG